MRTEQHGLQNYSSHDANSLNDIKLENLDSRIVNIDSRTNTVATKKPRLLVCHVSEARRTRFERQLEDRGSARPWIFALEPRPF